MAILTIFALKFYDLKNSPKKVKFLVRIRAIVIAKNPKGQVAETSRLARRSLGVRAV